MTEPRVDLRSLYSLSGLLRDTNGDDFPDALAASVILGEGASPLEGVAAVHLAARLGLETMGLDLPLVRLDTQLADVPAGLPLLVVGTQNRVYEQMTSNQQLDWSGIGQDDGLIQIIADGFDGRTVILVAGQTDAGTLAAANYLATTVVPGAAEASTTATVYQRHGSVSEPMKPGEAASAGSEAITRYVVPADQPGSRQLPAGRERVSRLSLASLYSLDGYLRDHDGDLLPDGTNLMLVLAVEGTAELWAAAADLAARVGLESGGLTFPLAILDSDLDEPEKAAELGGLILVGRQNRLTRQLTSQGKLSTAEQLSRGAATVRFVEQAFGDNGALVVTGMEQAAQREIMNYLARQAPYLSDVRRGEPTLGDVERGARELAQGRSAAGQAAAALSALDDALQAVNAGERALQSVSLDAYVDKPDPGLAAHLRARLESALASRSAGDVQVQDVKGARTIAERERSFSWEVDDFWTVFSEKIEPKLRADAGEVTIDVRLSESKEIRERIKQQIEERVAARGIPRERINVRVISAYKQGFSWLEEVVLPRLTGLPVASIRLQFQEFNPGGNSHWVDVPVIWLEMTKPPEERRLLDMAGAIKELREAGTEPWLGFPIRWLQELYPIDEILARGLNLSWADVRFEMADIGSTYRIEALDRDGAVIFSDALSVPYAERNYLDIYPEWGKVHVTTGWVSAVSDGQTLADQRIITDLEQFWELYQEFLPLIEEHVLSSTDGSPTADKQPFLREVLFEVWASEPNEEMDIRHEIFSSLEALHEDLYFVSLDYFMALGNKHVGKNLLAPGQFIPLLHNTPEQAGRAKITLNAFAAPTPMLSLRATFTDGTKQVIERELSGIASDLSLSGISRHDQSDDLLIELTAPEATENDLDQLRKLASAAQELQAAGLYAADLSWPGVAEVRVRTGDVGTAPIMLLSGADATSVAQRVDQVAAAEPVNGRLVPLDHVIGYEETESILRALDRHPEANMWLAGGTFQGRKIYALDMMLPTGTQLWSQAKASIFKPTYHLNCRHHANEISATTAGLWLADLLLTDPEYRPFLERVNLCLVPFENADGAVLHYALQEEHPNWMHHAARYNAAGLEFHSEYFNEETKFPEAKVRPDTWRTWLPDIVVDCHERPGHEWRQIFAGYTPVAWSYLWILPSLFTGIMRYTDTPEYPHHLGVARAMRQAVVDEINADEEIRSWNLDWQDRYRKYAYDWMPEKSPVQYYEDVQFHFSPLEPNPAATDLMQRNPQVTVVSWTTEVADETPQGDFLALCARATLTANRAVLKLLADASYSVERTATQVDESGTQVRIALTRPRPIVPSALSD